MKSIYNFDISMLGEVGDFAGVGSRRVNAVKSFKMFKIGFCMALSGYRLNSGAADGSDTSFEYGYRCAIEFLSKYIDLPENVQSKMMQVFLPWPGFNGREEGNGILNYIHHNALALTSKYHQNWPRLSEQVRNMMGRNSMQILGIDLEHKVKFVICDTPDGAYTAEMTNFGTGGTGQAIRIADDHNVKVFNLSNPEHLERIDNWITKIENEFISKYGLDIKTFSEDWYKNYIGLSNVVEGDLIEMAKQGKIDVLVHGCNIHNVKGSGFAKFLFDAFPEAYEADQKTVKGDKKKLGTYSSADVMVNGKKMTIVNAYTQEWYGRDPNKLYVDYESVRKSFNAIAKEFRGRQIAMPRIGAGLANGCWITLSNIVKHATRFMSDPLLVVQPGEFELDMNNQYFSMEDYILPVRHDDNFVFFFGQEDPFSNWHYSKFYENGTMFETMEQYMMYHKAMLMGDKDKAIEILRVPKGEPRECKRLGQEVCQDNPDLTWNEPLWIENREKIVIKGAIQKYAQNLHLLQPLLATGNRRMVEASPYDNIWGVKMKATNRNITSPDKWNGLNLLGKDTDIAREYIVANPHILCEKGQELLNEAIKFGYFEKKPEYSEQLSLM